ncbi:hypothetical protein MAM1_0053d03468 [Mucor ambiguus]|uniref:Uncharacterized protein n=1 Tax=Mucor ambiguus TaxID=91626 RepID=A0A0C9MLK4_9FUNG|nr:hypothetical protein MAM1_0053d03468 [Mucor ambiguus]
MSPNIATNSSFEDENEGDAVDSKTNENGTANAVEATTVIISSVHAEQEVIYQMMLPYLQLQNTVKFGYI